MEQLWTVRVDFKAALSRVYIFRTNYQIITFILCEEPTFRTAGGHGGVRVDVKYTSPSTRYTLFIGGETVGPTGNQT
jgi:hypothetical protein